MTANKWISDFYAPLANEVEAFDLEVRGTIPAELNGRYLRNGPNPMAPVDPETHHWFVGDAMVHGVSLREGKAEWYRAKLPRSTAISEMLGEEPARGERHSGLETANTNVVGIGGRTFAIAEAGSRPIELSRDLDTIEHSNLGGTLPNGYTAHPKVDPATGNLHAVAYYWGIPHLQYIVIGPDAKVLSVQEVAVDGGPMVHDCAITESSVLVFDLPVGFDLDVAMSGRFPYVWQPERTSRIGILPLGGQVSDGQAGDVVWCEVEPCYVFHVLNARDDGAKRIIVDVVRHPKVFDDNRNGPDDGAPRLWRWTIDRETRRVTEQQLSDQPLEFTRIDERRVGREQRWGYATEIEREGGNGFAGRLVRIDGKSGDTEVIDLGPGRIGGEWVMIPRHGDSAEDDGWLMSFVYDRNTDRSDLTILSAADPSAGPVAQVMLPNRVPAGFHGNWIAD